MKKYAAGGEKGGKPSKGLASGQKGRKSEIFCTKTGTYASAAAHRKIGDSKNKSNASAIGGQMKAKSQTTYSGESKKAKKVYGKLQL